MAMDTDSARTTSVEASSVLPSKVTRTGSGSHGPTYSSRRRLLARKVFSDWRLTICAR